MASRQGRWRRLMRTEFKRKGRRAEITGAPSRPASPRVTDALVDGNHWIKVSTIATTPAVVGGLALYLFGAILWLLVLAQIDVTQAYPFVGLGFLITMALGMLLLGESVSSARIAGTVLVATGVLLVARS